MLSNQSTTPRESKAPFILWRPFVALWRWLVPPTQADRDRQSRRSRLVGAALVVIIAVSLCGAALVYARPLYDACQDWYATRLVKQARSLADQGEIVAAVMRAQRAYKIAPDNQDAIRLNAEFYTRLKRTEALYFWDKLATHLPLTPAEEAQRIRSLVHADRRKEARQLLDEWMTRNAPQGDTLGLAQEVYGAGFQLSPLLSKLKAYAASHPEDRQSRLQLAQLQLDSGDPGEEAEALASLLELADGNEATSLHALGLLSDLPTLPPRDIPRIIERLKTHPLATAVHQVRAYQLRLRLRPDQRRLILAEAVQQFSESKRADLLHLVRWLVEEKEFQQVLVLVDEADAVAFQPLMESYFTSLTALGRLDDLRRLVNDPRVKAILTPANAAFYQLHLAFVTRQPLAELRARMETVTLHAKQEGRMEMLLAIGEYGVQRSMPDLAEPAYQAALRSRRFYALALEGLLRATRLNGNTSGHLKALQDANKQWPDNQSYRESLLYLQLLVGLHLETALHQATSLAETRPNDSATRLLAAMAGWRMRDLDFAKKHLPNIDPTGLEPGQRSVFAAITHAAGKSAEARSAVLGIPADSVMFPQERALLTRAP